MAAKLTLTVSQLNEYIRRMMQLDPVLHSVELKGEISNLKFHQTGTVFFTLKDELSAIACVGVMLNARTKAIIAARIAASTLRLETGCTVAAAAPCALPETWEAAAAATRARFRLAAVETDLRLELAPSLKTA